MIKGEITLAIKISHLKHFGVSNCRLSFWGPVSLRNPCCRWQLLQQHLPASTTQDSGRGRVCGGWLPVSSIWHPRTASVQRQSGTPDRGWPVWWWFGGRWHVMIGSCGEMMDDYSGENDMWLFKHVENGWETLMFDDDSEEDDTWWLEHAKKCWRLSFINFWVKHCYRIIRTCMYRTRDLHCGN